MNCKTVPINPLVIKSKVVKTLKQTIQALEYTKITVHSSFSMLYRNEQAIEMYIRLPVTPHYNVSF